MRTYETLMKLLPFILPLLILCLGCRHKGQPEYQREPLHYWEAKAASKEPDQRRTAAEALGNIGPTGLPALAKLLRDNDHLVRAAANLAVIGMGWTAVPELKKLMSDPDKDLRAAATDALTNLLVNMGPAGVPQLIELLKHPQPTCGWTPPKPSCGLTRGRPKRHSRPSGNRSETKARLFGRPPP